MKKQILTIATLACISLVGASNAVASPGHHKDPMRIFTKLELSDQQKREMKAIFKATRENNSVYAAEKEAISAQMHDLMNMPSWDQASAEIIIKSQLEQRKEIALNKAKARNQAYNLLTDEQKAVLAEKELNRAQKGAKKLAHDASHSDVEKQDGKYQGKRKDKGSKMHSGRLAKALKLTDTQVEQFKAIHANTKQQMLSLKDQGSNHRANLKAIVQSAQFDENLWLEAYNNNAANMLAFKLVQTKAHYDRILLLTDEQKQKFEKMKEKMKEKRGMHGSTI